MTRLIEICLPDTERATWTGAMEIALKGTDATIAPAGTPPDQIDYLVYNIDSGVTDFSPYTGLRAILNTWAGVEAVVGRVTWPDHIPFCRMVEDGMTRGMTEYLTGHTMRYHLDIDRAIRQSTEGRWQKWLPPLASERGVGILGLGALGQSLAGALIGLGFRPMGWSRTPRDIAGVDCHHGAEGLATVLSRAEILVLILPLTPDTTNLMNGDTLAALPRGACLINAGRGGLIDDDALLEALASGHVRHATLDVFRTEPLRGDHPYWRHPNVTVTPHIAAETRPKTAAEAIVAQIRRDLAGEPLLHIVDPARGY